MKKENFIIVSITPWDFEYGSNIQDIAYELAKNHQVLFVNIPLKITELKPSANLKWADHRRKVIKSRKNQLKKVNNNLTILTTPVIFAPINRLKVKPLFSFFNWINNFWYAKSIKKAAQDLGLKNYVLINDNDFYSAQLLPQFIKPKTSVYYLRDNFRAMEYWQSNVYHSEPQTIRNYDMTLTNSVYLANYAGQYTDRTAYVGQGCDIDFFTQTPKPNQAPEDLGKLQTPIIGYIGALNAERLDISLIAYLAKSNTDKSIVLIGPEDEKFKNSELHEIENIHFLGSKDFSQLVDYISYFDICINPQNINDITIGNYPRKVDEYLAVGKPVVTTFTEAMVPFKSVCYLAKDKIEYSKMLILALEEDSEEKIDQRKTFAQAHTWANFVNTMLNYINEKKI